MPDKREFKVVKTLEDADPGSVAVTLFKSDVGSLCGWYLAPARIGEATTYLADSTNTLAAVAIVKAIDHADRVGVNVTIIDPDGLWANVWGE